MTTVDYSPEFERSLKKIKDSTTKLKLKKQIKEIVTNPNIGKPMRYGRKGRREIYISPFRLSYAWMKDKDKIILLDLYHKDFQ